MLSNGRKCKCKTAKIDRHMGAKVPGNERTFVPGSEKAWVRKGQGAKVPGGELARVLLAHSLRGANWPGSEKARYQVVYTCIGHSVQLFDHLVVIALYYFMLWSDKLNK